MTQFDPYLLLGIGRDATVISIKAAYRQRVQTAHPDRGGDPEAFIAIVKAFGLLSDPEARRLYDDAGIVDEDAVKTFRRDVTQILLNMFDAAVETASTTGLDLGKVDFVAQMSAAVKSSLGDAKISLRRAERDAEALAGLKTRIRRRDDGRNIFAERLDAQIGTKMEQQGQIRRRVALLETAIVELDNYNSEVELMAALEATP